jgi:hypothetical protein
MNAAPDEFAFYRRAMYWVNVVVVVVALMVLPGVAGLWADKRWGTAFWAIAGFAVGLVAGFSYLLLATARRNNSKRRRPAGGTPRNDDGATNGGTD